MTIHIDLRGAFTIPKELRDKYGLGGQAILEETADGLILRRTASYPAKIVSQKPLAELQQMNAEVVPSRPLGNPAMIGYARRFHPEPKSTTEWMKELREGFGSDT